MKRTAYLLLALAATGLAITAVVSRHASWWPLVVFAIAPDLALLAGSGPGLARGQIHPRVVPLYNAVHRFWAPAILVTLMLALQAPAWVAAGLAWIAHIGFDRALGFGLRNSAGFQREGH